MPASNTPGTQNQDEIDLLYLFVKLGEFFKKIFLGLFGLIGSILLILVRKWYVFGIAILLSLLTAFIVTRLADDYYHSQLVLRSNASNNQPFMSSLDRLGEYTRGGNHSALAKELQMTNEEARQIKKLETFWFYDLGKDGIIDGIDYRGRFLSDTNVAKVDSIFSIQVKVYDPAILEDLEDHLVLYLEEDEFFQSLNKQRLAHLEAQLAQTEYEIEKLDSLQKREYYTQPDELRQKDGQIVFTAEKDVRLYHLTMFRLLEQKQACERDLNLYGSVVTVVEGFHEPAETVNSLFNTAKKFIWYFLGLAFIIALFITFRSKIQAFVSSS